MIPLLQMRQDYARRIGLTPQLAQSRVAFAQNRVQQDLLDSGQAIPGSGPPLLGMSAFSGSQPLTGSGFGQVQSSEFSADPYAMQPYAGNPGPTGGGLIGTPSWSAAAQQQAAIPPVQSGPGNAAQRWQSPDTTARYYERKMNRMTQRGAANEVARISNRIGGPEQVPGYGNPSPRNDPNFVEPPRSSARIVFQNSPSGWEPYL